MACVGLRCCFSPVCTSQIYIQCQMGAVFLAGHICSIGGKRCASPQLNPFEEGGSEVRLWGWRQPWSRWELALGQDEP